MLIVCPNCATSYRVVAENLGDTGRSVRCVSCHHVWFEEPRIPEPETKAFSADSHDIGSGDMDFSDPEDAGSAARQPIRPPLNDVVDIGDPSYSQGDPGEVAETGDSDFTGPQHALHSDTEASQTGAAPSIVPGISGLSDADADTSVERVAARRNSRRPKPQRGRLLTASAALPALICVLILTLGGLVFLRQQVVRYLPQTASLYASLGMPVNLRGLQFGNIKTTREAQDGVPVLVVEGEIVGTGGRLIEVPRLRFAVLDRAGKEIYAWTARPERTLLPAGETLPFRSRLASPPAEASGVTVRFFNRHDAKAGFM
jgi:predicted Zn finger-like uncharacterized protein